MSDDPRSMSRSIGQWKGTTEVIAFEYECGYCGNQIGTVQGWQTNAREPAYLTICPRCQHPTFFDKWRGRRFPGSPPGHHVENCPEDLSDLYDEARRAASAGAYTAAVMLCRKMLMSIAVREGDKEGKSFAAYIDYLEKQGFFSPKMKEFVDYIRSLGNDANHEVARRSEDDAIAAIEFVGALLRHNYELPAKVPVKRSVAPTPVRGNGPNPKPAGT